MLYQILKHLEEAGQYLEHVGGRLQKDKKLAEQISLNDLNTDLYAEAIHHIHIALDMLAQQRQVSAKYQQEQDEKEDQETKQHPHKISRTISEKI